MDDQNEQTTKRTNRAKTTESTAESPTPKAKATARTSTRPKQTPKAEAPTTTGSKRPKAEAPKAEAPKGDAAATAPPPSDTTPPAEGARVDATGDGTPSRDEMSIAFTPGQMAVGGAIVAGLLVVGVRLLLGRRRGRS